MAGKPPVFCSNVAYRTLDEVTKNTLIDLAFDLARAELGENTPEPDLIYWIENKLVAVHAARHDRAVDLVGIFNRHHAESREPGEL
jgi:hypothetical protein